MGGVGRRRTAPGAASPSTDPGVAWFEAFGVAATQKPFRAAFKELKAQLEAADEPVAAVVLPTTGAGMLARPWSSEEIDVRVDASLPEHARRVAALDVLADAASRPLRCVPLSDAAEAWREQRSESDLALLAVQVGLCVVGFAAAGELVWLLADPSVGEQFSSAEWLAWALRVRADALSLSRPNL